RDGGFSAWSNWTECSRQCDVGTRERHRFCNNPYPAHGGNDCTGERFQEEDCQTQACPVHGGLSEWSSWDKCDKLCADGQQRRHRSCTNPKPRCGGKDCTALNLPTTETQAC
ncbi:predicted protein, partial [Nematostella vectensis]